jgi:hypothetical protein
MKATRALLRWASIFGLCLIAAVLIPTAWALHRLTGISLDAAEWAKTRLSELRGAV